MSFTRRDKTVGHFHTDPILVLQENASVTLSIGQVVYLDTDGIYKPALAIEDKQLNVVGVVWAFVGTSKFYLRTNPGPMQYRFPLPASFFDTSILGRVDEFSPNSTKIPGGLGQKLYLSETVAGGLQSTKPNTYALIVGYKTEYGFIYRPDLIKCCTVGGSSSSSSSSIVSNSNCFVHQYQVCNYDYDCENNVWIFVTSKEVKLWDNVPSEILNVGLLGTVEITGSDYRNIVCNDGIVTCSVSGASSVVLPSFAYSTNHTLCQRTIITPLLIYGNVSDLFECVNGSPVEICDTTQVCPDPSTIPECYMCCVTGNSSGSSSSSSSSG